MHFLYVCQKSEPLQSVSIVMVKLCCCFLSPPAESCNGGGILSNSGSQQSTDGIQQASQCDQSQKLVCQTCRGKSYRQQNSFQQLGYDMNIAVCVCWGGGGGGGE